VNTVDMIRDRMQALGPLKLDIIDESHLHAGHAGARDGGGHYRLTIVSPRFAGQGTMQRHRLVYDAAGDLMQGAIHALSITAKAPDETL
jgi:BolA protein